jgi:YQGE family putative transporter
MSNKINDIRAIRILIWNVLVKSAKNVFQIFLNIYIWKQTQDIQTIAIFNLVYLSTHMVFFTAFAPIVKRGYRNTLHVFSLVWFAWVYLWIMYLWESSLDHLIAIPIAIWFFNSIYWINFHNTQLDLTTHANRWNFEWLRKSMSTVASIITPTLVW